jgi:hypothetical protein
LRPLFSKRNEIERKLQDLGSQGGRNVRGSVQPPKWLEGKLALLLQHSTNKSTADLNTSQEGRFGLTASKRRKQNKTKPSEESKEVRVHYQQMEAIQVPDGSLLHARVQQSGGGRRGVSGVVGWGWKED